ncbi:Crp/Fnr family transcriptional regulator [Candidatus Viridilinea mediisalina]|uniref:Crp/Fnr family transcriptional regulator n=1 Tax=Candidatus Viridilinea mediisalina TaxID=2024553 RepID=A0A2A6RKM1_9CHLR|nr:Crp/Fnr family transcriptional regulator [Candidatus Viridilinea mediisalina]PDW03418.1 Crp/Fnr family transcriptional regulator [Candidatus Viridilinea mediisalina]
MTIEDLRAIPLLASLDPVTLGDTARRAQRCTFRPGQQILTEGEEAPGLFLIQRGRVRLSRMAPDGREQVLAMLGPGAHFDPVPLFDGGLNPSSARAMSRVVCLLLPREDLLALIRRHPDLAYAALSAMAGQLRELVALVEDLAFRSVRARLARQLLVEAGEGAAQLTQQELAERAGTVREMAGRALRRLAEEGLVRLERGRVIVLDHAGLARVVEE